MYVSLSSNGFWILRVTIYSRIHKSYAPYFCFPFFFFPMRSLLLYLRPGKLRWWWVFTHPLNYTLSAQLKNPGGPSAEYYQNLGSRISKKPSNRIWTKKSPDFFRAFTLRIFITKEKRQSGKKGFHFVSSASTNTLWLYVFNLPQVQVTIKSCYPREILIYALCKV